MSDEQQQCPSCGGRATRPVVSRPLPEHEESKERGPAANHPGPGASSHPAWECADCHHRWAVPETT